MVVCRCCKHGCTKCELAFIVICRFRGTYTGIIRDRKCSCCTVEGENKTKQNMWMLSVISYDLSLFKTTNWIWWRPGTKMRQQISQQHFKEAREKHAILDLRSDEDCVQWPSVNVAHLWSWIVLLGGKQTKKNNFEKIYIFWNTYRGHTASLTMTGTYVGKYLCFVR